MNNLFKGAALFVGGILVGAAAALLVAPKSGEELRNDLADLAEDAKKRTQEYCEQMEAKVKAEVENLKAKVEQATAQPAPPKPAAKPRPQHKHPQPKKEA